MEILANNRARINARYDSSCFYRGLLPAVIFFIFFLYNLFTGIYNLFTGIGVGLFWVWLGFALLTGFVALMYLDLYLRWHRAVETVSVQHEMLVIEYHKCIFKRRKEIPLSAIRKVETYTGHGGWYWGTAPETLSVTYSNSIKYNFGICMSDSRRDDLARKIMDLAQRYV